MEKQKTFTVEDVKIGVIRSGVYDTKDNTYQAKIFKDGALICETESPSEFEEVLRVVVGNIACHLVDYK